jgi:3-dehydroquinate dehydratase-2
MTTILVLNGPNLNLLGKREPAIYGAESLADIEEQLRTLAKDLSLSLVFQQSNAEAELIGMIHAASDNQVDFIIINPGALTHTSVALRDALLGVAIPFIEVHISNVFAREAFRQHSFLSDVAVGVISGLGSQGYALALTAALKQLQHH